MTGNGRYTARAGDAGATTKLKQNVQYRRVSRNHLSLSLCRARSCAVKGKTQTPYRDFYFRRRVAFPMRDFPDGSMRPRDFSAFSRREPAENGRVFTRQRRARTRDRGARARARARARKGTSAGERGRKEGTGGGRLGGSEGRSGGGR